MAPGSGAGPRHLSPPAPPRPADSWGRLSQPRLRLGPAPRLARNHGQQPGGTAWTGTNTLRRRDAGARAPLPHGSAWPPRGPSCRSGGGTRAAPSEHRKREEGRSSEKGSGCGGRLTCGASARPRSRAAARGHGRRLGAMTYEGRKRGTHGSRLAGTSARPSRSRSRRPLAGTRRVGGGSRLHFRPFGGGAYRRSSLHFRLRGSCRGSQMMETERLGEGAGVERRSRQESTLDP